MIKRPIKLHVQTKTVQTRTLELTGEYIVQLLRNNGHNIPAPDVVCDLEVKTWVPGGGDYSSTWLDIRDGTIKVKWTETGIDVKEEP